MRTKKQKMSKKKGILSLALSLAMCVTTMADPMFSVVKANEGKNEEIVRSLIPKPFSYEVSQGSFTLNENAKIEISGKDAEETASLVNTAEVVVQQFRTATGYALPVASGNEAAGNIVLTTVGADTTLGDEGYDITATENNVTIEANEPAGMFNGLQTLRQLLPAEIEKAEKVSDVAWEIPCATIHDKPEYAYRGMQLDVSRHFFDVNEVKRQMDLASQYKINKLHLHLADDQGWRLEMKGEMYGESLDKLRTIGATTSTSWNGVTKSGQYTQEDFKELVRYAAERNIEIIPEFDMPSHSWAALVSLEFLNSTEDGKPHAQGYDNTKPYEGVDVGFCSFEAHNEKTYEFIDEVFKQVSAISPSEYLHIGGDEAHSTSHDDYIYFMNRVTEIAKKYGKTPIGWQNYDDIVEDKANTITQFWSTGNAKLKKGINYILSPADRAYMDMKYDKDCPVGLQWAGYNPVDDVYTWDMTDYGSRDQIVGLEAPLWTETVTNTDEMDYMIYPKLPALAEIAWTPKADRSWNEYKTRMKDHGPRLDYQDVNYRKDEQIWEPVYEPVNAQWSLDEGEGTSINDTTGAYPGTLHGGATWTDGKIGKALRFDGTGYIDLGISDLKGNWTAGMWVNRSANSSTNTVLLSGTQGEIKLEQWKSTTKVGITEFGVEDYTFDYTAPIGEWVHLAFVCDGAGTDLYVNGEYKDHLDVAIKGPAARVGANNKEGLSDTGFLYGSLDEVKIFNEALSAEEVKEMASQDIVNYTKDQLKQLIISADLYQEKDYTAASWEDMQQAKKDANEVLNDENATQDGINTVFLALAAAVQNLKPAANDNSIRIASYNIAAGKHPDIEKMNAQLKEYGIDVVGVQEVDYMNGRNNFDMLKKFADLGAYPYYSFQKAIDYNGGEYGIGILSSLAIKEKSGGALNSEGTEEARAWQRILVEKDGKEIAIYNTHLTYESMEARERQLREVLAMMDADPCEYKALTGDFNTDQNLNEVYPMLKNYNITNGNNDVWFDTYNGVDDTMKVYSIDNIVTTRNLKMSNAQMVENKLSDHNMFFADFEFLEEEIPSRQLLNHLLADAKEYGDEEYTPASYEVLQKAIAAGEALSETATQKEINQAVDQLEETMKGLENLFQIINDAETGTGINQFNYVGKWQTSTGYPEMFYQGDEHWFNFARYVEGDTVPYFTITFEGTGIELFGNIDTMMGIYEVSIDDGESVDVDAYASVKKTQSLLFSVRDLDYGTHTLKLQTTKRKNTASTATDAEIDFAKVYNEKQETEDTTFVKTILKNAIDKAQTIVASDAFKELPSVVQNLINTRLQEANTVYADETAKVQEVLDAWLNLSDALHYSEFKADKTALKELVAICKEIDTEKYETASVEKLNEAIAAAEAVIADETALQARIDEAYDALLKAKEALVEKPVIIVDKSVLAAIIEKVETVLPNKEQYRQDDGTWEAMETALNSAKTIYEDEQATQEAVNNAATVLANAYANIRLLPDEKLLAQLEDFIQIAQGINRSLYAQADLAYIDEVSQEAQAMLNSQNLSEFDALSEKMSKALDIIKNNANNGKDDNKEDPEKPADQPSDQTQQPTNDKSSAQTGDTSQAAGTFAIVVLAGGAMLALLKKRRSYMR